MPFRWPTKRSSTVVSGASRFRCSEDVTSATHGGRTVLLDLRSESFFSIDELGLRIWSAIGRNASVDEIVARLRDPTTASTLSSALGMPREEVATALGEMSNRVEAVRDNPAQAAAEVRNGVSNLAARARANLSQTAAQVQPEATTSAWVAFGALLLSLLAAIAGAAVGRRGVVRRVSA